MRAKFEAAQIAIRVSGFCAPNGLLVDEILIEGSDVEVATDPLEWTLGENGKVTVRIGEAALRELILSKAPEQIQDVDVTLANDRIWVKAKVKMILSITASAELALRIEDSKKMFVELRSLDAIAAAARPMLEKQLEDMNPILNVDALPFALRVVSQQIEDGWLTLIGEVTSGTLLEQDKIA